MSRPIEIEISWTDELDLAHTPSVGSRPSEGSVRAGHVVRHPPTTRCPAY